jgi:hypothetical protein
MREVIMAHQDSRSARRIATRTVLGGIRHGWRGLLNVFPFQLNEFGAQARRPGVGVLVSSA